ncbi:hypothetical protein CYMTET_42854 [Cymbomonas tetramitiformis]|uniref:Uncharacterized protein n=1 Tax=Cymbomonas tetramitiformis TaxID=36881 RepID=A0AAE0C4P2_9CHLO|nr:hypothetical protein CYMTET_42854 [Cymbomonas tetramitiformis]
MMTSAKTIGQCSVSGRRHAYSPLKTSKYPVARSHGRKSGCVVRALAGFNESPVIESTKGTVADLVSGATGDAASQVQSVVIDCAEAGTCGTVDAPPVALIAGAVLVTLGSFLAAYILQPGIDASIEMQERDKSYFGKKK